METKIRFNRTNSSLSTRQEAAATLDPLIQPINDQNSEPVYVRRQSSIFYIAPNNVLGETKIQTNVLNKYWTCLERFSGIFYSLLASLLFTCSNFALKQFHINMLDVLVIRIFIQILFSFGYIIYKGYSLYPHRYASLVFCRSILAAAGTISFYLGLSTLPLSCLTTIRFTQVVWTAILASIIFHERFNVATVIASILTLIGVVCVTQPSFLFPRLPSQNKAVENMLTFDNRNHQLGILYAMSCAILFSLSIVLNKKLIEKSIQQSIIMFYFLLVTFLVSVSMQSYHWLHSKSISITKDFIIGTIIATLQLLPMILSEQSIKREHPSIITVAQSSDIIFALILQNLFTSVKTNLLAMLGSLLILTSIFILGGYKIWLDRNNRTCMSTINDDDVI